MVDNHRSRHNPPRTSIMRNGYARAQAVSVGPALKQESEKLQPSKKDRRVTITSRYRDTSHTPDRVSRIEKATGYHRRHRRSDSVSPDLARQLDKALDLERDELGAWAEDNLGNEQTRVNEEMMYLEGHFTSRLKFMQDLEDLVDAPFSNQTSGAFRQENDETGEWEEVEVVIEDRMRDYIGIIRQQEEKLKDLSQQWDISQVEIICVAVEVLGFSNTELHNEALEIAVKRIDNAGVSHKKNGERYVEAGKNITALKTELMALYDNTSKLTKKQQKQSWRMERKKILDNVKKALEISRR